MRKVLIIATLLAFSLTVPLLLAPTVEANHRPRIVMPYGQNERHIPIVAGYEVAPRPLGCDAGTIVPTQTYYAQNFDTGVVDYAIAKNINQVDNPNWYLNPFHVTNSIVNEKGTHDGHSGTGKLYFGNSNTGRMYSQRMGGTVTFPSFVVPTEPSYFAWNDKFEVEGLFGYDHMWIELVDQQTGQVYILCSTDTDVRPDKSSNDGAWSTCSPYRTMLCPTGIKGTGGLDCPGAVITPVGFCLPVFVDFGDYDLERIDPTAPHWESRYVQIPAEFIGKTVAVRFSADTADGVANAYLGWMADDIFIGTGIPVPEPYAYVAPVPTV